MYALQYIRCNKWLEIYLEEPKLTLHFIDVLHVVSLMCFTFIYFDLFHVAFILSVQKYIIKH